MGDTDAVTLTLTSAEVETRVVTIRQMLVELDTIFQALAGTLADDTELWQQYQLRLTLDVAERASVLTHFQLGYDRDTLLVSDGLTNVRMNAVRMLVQAEAEHLHILHCDNIPLSQAATTQIEENTVRLASLTTMARALEDMTCGKTGSLQLSTVSHAAMEEMREEVSRLQASEADLMAQLHQFREVEESLKACEEASSALREENLKLKEQLTQQITSEQQTTQLKAENERLSAEVINLQQAYQVLREFAATANSRSEKQKLTLQIFHSYLIEEVGDNSLDAELARVVGSSDDWEQLVQLKLVPALKVMKRHHANREKQASATATAEMEVHNRRQLRLQQQDEALLKINAILGALVLDLSTGASKGFSSQETFRNALQALQRSQTSGLVANDETVRFSSQMQELLMSAERMMSLVEETVMQAGGVETAKRKLVQLEEDWKADVRQREDAASQVLKQAREAERVAAEMKANAAEAKAALQVAEAAIAEKAQEALQAKAEASRNKQRASRAEAEADEARSELEEARSEMQGAKSEAKKAKRQTEAMQANGPVNIGALEARLNELETENSSLVRDVTSLQSHLETLRGRHDAFIHEVMEKNDQLIHEGKHLNEDLEARYVDIEDVAKLMLDHLEKLKSSAENAKRKKDSDIAKLKIESSMLNERYEKEKAAHQENAAKHEELQRRNEQEFQRLRAEMEKLQNRRVYNETLNAEVTSQGDQ